MSLAWLFWLGSLLGLIFGIIALGEIRRSRGWRGGNGLAISGILVGALSLLLIIPVALAGSAHPAGTTAGHPPVLNTRADVRVIASGFTQHSTTGISTISYGLVVANRSARLSARDVHVTVKLLDAAGRSVATSQIIITGIPAGGRFYLGGLAAPNVSLTAKQLDTAVTVGASSTQRLILPAATTLRLSPDTIAPGVTVPGYSDIAGIFRNPYHQPISPDATIYVVFYNAQGQIVGGDSEPAGASVLPGATVGFKFPQEETANAASLKASIDPCEDQLGIRVPGRCPATS